MNRLLLSIVTSIAVVVLGGAWLLRLQPSEGQGQPQKLELVEYSYTQIQMGMPVQLTIWSDSERSAQSAAKRAFEKIRELESLLSDYDPRSEVSQINRARLHEPVPVSPAVIELAQFCQKLYRDSAGAFDPGSGGLVELWRQARRDRQLPSPSELQSALPQSGWRHLEIDIPQRTIARNRSLKLDLGAVAKGYIGDQAIAILREAGIDSAKFQAGGDIVVSGAPPDKAGWQVEVEGLGQLIICDAAIAISGDSQQFLELDGQRYSHVIDPRTGQALTHRRAAVVVARRGTSSDSLATVGTILEVDPWQDVLRRQSAWAAWSWTVADPATPWHWRSQDEQPSWRWVPKATEDGRPQR